MIYYTHNTTVKQILYIKLIAAKNCTTLTVVIKYTIKEQFTAGYLLVLISINVISVVYYYTIVKDVPLKQPVLTYCWQYRLNGGLSYCFKVAMLYKTEVEKYM